MSKQGRQILAAMRSSRDRPTFDVVYMEFAAVLRRRSTCQRLQVGCVVVTEDNHQVLAIGYNGGPKGLYNDCQSLEPGLCGHLHAEINALLKMNYNDPSYKKMYVTTSPCRSCSVAIINAGIDEVIYLDQYRDQSGLALLSEAGLKVRKHGAEGTETGS